jgi:hypothetical protein
MRRVASRRSGTPVVAESHAVVEEAKAAGVSGGGIAEEVNPVLVPADGSVSTAIYPGSEIKGGFTILELPNHEAAVEWAGKIATACRCSQELRWLAGLHCGEHDGATGATCPARAQ